MLWARTEDVGAARSTGKAKGTVHTKPVTLDYTSAANDFVYLVKLGIPPSVGHNSTFARDPEIKWAAVFTGPIRRTSTMLVRRTRNYAEVSADVGRTFNELCRSLPFNRNVLAAVCPYPQALFRTGNRARAATRMAVLRRLRHECDSTRAAPTGGYTYPGACRRQQ